MIIESAKKETGLSITHKKDDDFANWYTDVLKSSELIDYYDISGCYILRPWYFHFFKFIIGHIQFGKKFKIF